MSAIIIGTVKGLIRLGPRSISCVWLFSISSMPPMPELTITPTLSGLIPGEMDPDDVGVIVSSGIGGMEEIEKSHTQLMERGPKRISPFTVPMMIADMAAGIVAIHLQAGGPNYAIVSACASGSHGIGEASEIIKRGDAVAMRARGSEAPITPLTMGAFCQIKATSERNDEPETACRPFHLGGDGFVMS